MKKMLVASFCVLVLFVACTTQTYRLTPGGGYTEITPEEMKASEELARRAEQQRREAEADGQETEIAEPAETEQAAEGAQASLVFERWLAAGPVPVPSPAFDEKTPSEQAAAILDRKHVNRQAWFSAGDEEPWLPGVTLAWSEAAAPEGSFELSAPPAVEGGAFAACLAAYIDCNRWQTVVFRVKATRPFALFVDGEEKARSVAVTAADADPAEETARCNLIRGKHRVLIKTVSPAGAEGAPWRISAAAEPGAGPETAALSTSPERTFADMNEAKNLSTVDAFALSPDGRLVAAVVNERSPGRPASVSLRILEMPEGREIDRLDASGGMGGIAWSPGGASFLFARRGDLMRHDLSTGATAVVLDGADGLGKFVWSPDGRFIYYAAAGKEKKTAEGHVRLRGLQDRLTDYSETAVLYVAPAGGGPSHPLTAPGDFAVEDFALSPDGKTIVFLKRYPIAERPFFRNELWLLDAPTGTARLLRATSFPFENMPAHFTWSPDGKRIAFIAPPDQVAPEDRRSETEHNYFENDLWLVDTGTGDLARLSDRFDEAVEAPLFWHPSDGCIYFVAHRHTKKLLARIAVDGAGELELLHDAPAVVENASAAESGRGAAFTGSAIDQPKALYYIDLAGAEPRLILDPNAEHMQDIRLGAWERFDFENDRGQVIEGFLFYPPDFDASRTYPLMVYYYGGTTPEVESFSTTYYHFMPANGYMLYVVNPAGAAGYGEAFSDQHVNDWGRLAAADIIAGVKKVIGAKPCVDAANIGGYGGSYGGFMTLSLITQTDLFKASCALYGISNLASYWGAGIWGYTYGDTAMALSYPWNRPDFFVERSPLFNADKVQSALLLMHGTGDVNVPVVESEQMFTALKLLGKEVAYVRFPGQDHGIAGTHDIYILHRRMMLEWFDKHLKGQPEAWEERWK